MNKKSWKQCKRADWLLEMLDPIVSRAELATLARECTRSQVAILPIDAISAVQDAGRDIASKAHNKQILARAKVGNLWADGEWEAAYSTAFDEAHKAMCAIIRARYPDLPNVVTA